MPDFSPAFWKWFGDSKVVTPGGNPLVVYHGSPHAFQIFDKARIGTQTDSGDVGAGFYFTQNPAEAKSYGKNVLAAYLRIEQPLIIWGAYIAEMNRIDAELREAPRPSSPNQVLVEVVRMLQEHKPEFEIDLVPKYTRTTMYDVVRRFGPRDFVGALVLEGYDGVFYMGEYVVFEPSQIKSADSNDGTWDSDDPDIRSNPGWEIEDLPPWRIQPLHEVRDPVKFEQLVQAMRTQGWVGRPLIVARQGDGWQAWTGSHRLAAARESGLETVPVVVVPEEIIVKLQEDNHPSWDARYDIPLDPEGLARDLENYGGSPELAALLERGNPPGEAFIRFEHRDGLGLMNNSGLERGKLSDDEDFELDELLGLGLRQPLGVASGAIFAFTPEGVKAHARLIKLLRKASKTGVRKILLDPAAYRVVWQSDDGQVALVPA